MTRADLKNNVDIIFAHWQKVMDFPLAKLLPVREKLIRARLKEGYTVEQIIAAIDGCRNSKFHLGDNDNGTVYADLTLICRNGAKLEWFISLATRKAKNLDRIAQNTVSTDTPSKRAVRCKTCGDLGMIDSHPNDRGFVPGRNFTSCPDCSSVEKKL